MEVSKRALGVLTTVAIAAAVWLAVRESTDNRPRRIPQSPERIAASALADTVARFNLRTRTNEVRDRVETAIAQAQPGPAMRVMVLGRGLVETLAPLTDSLLLALDLPSTDLVPLRLALVEAPLRWPAYRAYVNTFTLLPSSTGSPDCTAVRVVWADRVEPREERLSWQQLPWNGAVGPCWYLANFGMPGPAIRAWLDGRYWDVAGVIPPHPRRASFQAGFESAPNLLYRLLGEFGGVYRGGSATIESCASDKPLLCEAALFDSPYPAGLLPDGIVGTERLNAYTRRPDLWLTSVPPWASRELLAMMVEDLGAARFSAFWTSQAAVPEAFQAAAGVPFAEWYRKQLRRDFRQAGFPDPGNKVFWPSAIAVLALALWLTFWGAGRRQVR